MTARRNCGKVIQMTIKGFAEKYEIPYSLAWQASCNVTPVATMTRNTDYPEEEMYREVQHILNERSLEHGKQVGLIQQQKTRMRWIRLNKS